MLCAKQILIGARGAINQSHSPKTVTYEDTPLISIEISAIFLIFCHCTLGFFSKEVEWQLINDGFLWGRVFLSPLLCHISDIKNC